MASKRVLVINDLHRPFHDPLAVKLALFVAKDIQVDEIVINGDLMDMYAVNSHGPSHPDVYHTLETELQDTKEFLIQLRDTFPKAKIMFIFGNHEFRLERFIVDKCKSFHNILKLEHQLTLKHLNIDHIPYNDEYELCKDLYIQHSPPSYGVNGARTSLMKKLDASYLWGCTHRQQHATISGRSGQTYHAWFNGWLGSSALTDEHKRVFSYTKGHSNWQQCFMIFDVINDKFFGHQCSIIEGTTSIDGGFYDVR